MTTNVHDALDALVHDVALPPHLLGQVQAGAARRRRRRRAAVALVTPLVVLGTGVGISAAVRHDGSGATSATLAARPATSSTTVTAPSGAAIVDGVTVTYLPAGFSASGGATTQHALNADGAPRRVQQFALSTSCLRPTNCPAADVFVEVQRGAPTDLDHLRAMLVQNSHRSVVMTTVDGHPALLSRDDRPENPTFIEWVVNPELSLAVGGSSTLSDSELLAVARGLRPGTP